MLCKIKSCLVSGVCLHLHDCVAVTHDVARCIPGLCLKILQVAYLYHICVNDVFLRQKPVLHLLQVHDGCQMELAKVVQQQAVNSWDILHSHWPQA